jgi:NAD(P)H-dependent FMN reductase
MARNTARSPVARVLCPAAGSGSRLLEVGIPTLLVEIITGTTREGRFSERVVAWVADRLTTRHDFDLELVDLRDHPLPFFDGAAPARTGRDYSRDDVARFGQTIDRADGYVIVTGEYNHGYPAVLKNAMDWTFVEWRRKPITFVSWGNVGGARAVEQLREVAVEFEMAPLRHAVHILPDVMMAARQPGATDDASVFAPLEPKVALLADDLAWWITTLAAGRTGEASR